MTDDDEKPGLFERIAAGDATAVKDCMDVYGSLVWSLARRYTQSAADAEDATQEIFLELWKSASRYDRSMGKETTFIATIARRRLIDRIRAASRRPATEEYDDSIGPGATDSIADSGAVAVDLAVAERALARLSSDQREVLMLGVVEGLTQSEIATETGRPLGTVKTLMRRGLIRLRALLEEDGTELVSNDG